MNQEIIKPDKAPHFPEQGLGMAGGFMAAAGITLMTACMLGSAAAITIWAFANQMGLGHTTFLVLIGLGLIPVAWATIWTAGRARHVEQRLARGRDVDRPVFKAFYYWTPNKAHRDL